MGTGRLIESNTVRVGGGGTHKVSMGETCVALKLNNFADIARTTVFIFASFYS